MVNRTDPSAEPRIPLNRERVLRAAIVIADRGGLESLSMRRLGEELGVKAMSLYNHVANKGDVLDGIVDIVSSEIEVPSNETDWKTALRRSAISKHEVLRRHHWASSLWMSRLDPGPARLRYMDSVLGTLRQANFSMVMTHHAFHAVENHILGYTLQEADAQVDREVLAKLGARFLRGLPGGAYPHLAEHVTYHIESGQYDEGDFEFGLDLILDGIDRLRATA